MCFLVWSMKNNRNMLAYCSARKKNVSEFFWIIKGAWGVAPNLKSDRKKFQTYAFTFLFFYNCIYNCYACHTQALEKKFASGSSVASIARWYHLAENLKNILSLSFDLFFSSSFFLFCSTSFFQKKSFCFILSLSKKRIKLRRTITQKRIYFRLNFRWQTEFV